MMVEGEEHHLLGERLAQTRNEPLVEPGPQDRVSVGAHPIDQSHGHQADRGQTNGVLRRRAVPMVTEQPEPLAGQAIDEGSGQYGDLHRSDLPDCPPEDHRGEERLVPAEVGKLDPEE